MNKENKVSYYVLQAEVMKETDNNVYIDQKKLGAIITNVFQNLDVLSNDLNGSSASVFLQFVYDAANFCAANTENRSSLLKLYDKNIAFVERIETNNSSLSPSITEKFITFNGEYSFIALYNKLQKEALKVGVVKSINIISNTVLGNQKISKSILANNFGQEVANEIGDKFADYLNALLAYEAVKAIYKKHPSLNPSNNKDAIILISELQKFAQEKGIFINENEAEIIFLKQTKLNSKPSSKIKTSTKSFV